jgi:hypothetical protein
VADVNLDHASIHFRDIRNEPSVRLLLQRATHDTLHALTAQALGAKSAWPFCRSAHLSPPHSLHSADTPTPHKIFNVESCV